MADKVYYLDGSTQTTQEGYVIDGQLYTDEAGTQGASVGSQFALPGGPTQYVGTDGSTWTSEQYWAEAPNHIGNHLSAPLIENTSGPAGPRSGNGGGGGGSGGIAGLAASLNLAGAKYTPAQLAGLGIGDLYGITYDQQQILDILNKATQAEYALKEQEFAQTEKKFYNALYGTQQTALDTIRRSNAQAVATGASRGIAAANELSAILGLESESAGMANDLANQRNNLMSEKAAAIAENDLTALETSNQVKNTVAQLDATKYGYDTQAAIGVLDYLASLAGVAGGAYSADKAYDASVYSADKAYDASVYSADKSAEASMYGSDQGLAGILAQVEANERIAAQQRAASNTGGGGGGRGGYYSNNNGTPTDSTGATPTSSNDLAAQHNTPDTALPLAGTNAMYWYNDDGTISLQLGHSTDSERIIITHSDLRAIIREGTLDVITNPDDYILNQLGLRGVVNGTTVTVGGHTYRYNTARHMWEATDGTIDVGTAKLGAMMAAEQAAQNTPDTTGNSREPESPSAQILTFYLGDDGFTYTVVFTDGTKITKVTSAELNSYFDKYGMVD
jgi:hypothetical protein